MTSPQDPRLLGRRKFLVSMGAAALTPALLAACGSDKKAATPPADTTGGTTGATTGGTTGGTASGIPQAIIDAAKKDGKINLIALPDSWANYKGVLAEFKTTYGIDFNVANPDGSSADEVKAATDLKGQATQPDSIDVAPSFAYDGAKSGLFTPYKVSTFADIPDAMKDPDGNWVAAYYGIIAIGVNEKLAGGVPKSFKELADVKYKGKLALNGDPRKSGSGVAGVIAAALANGGSFDDISAGIDYFAKLKKDGILLPIDLTPAVILSGEAAIGIDWSYNYPDLTKLAAEGTTLVTNVPTDGVYGGFYAQGIVAGSPHQDAAKLWLEWLVSDGGATQYMKGGAFPARYAAMDKAGSIPADLKASLPSADIVAQVKFPTPDQVAKAKETIAKDWGPKVSGN
jgi:putative spermidine/putrescine transport system substrate-binding protein